MMIENPRLENTRQTSEQEQNYFSPPSAVTLPKRGGAIKGMGVIGQAVNPNNESGFGIPCF